MLSKVISGGQTGVDQAALRAARVCGVETGGWAPKGWLTEEGPAPWLAEFGLVEHASAYPARTRANAEAAHATLILADKLPLTGGTLLTYDIAYRAGQRGAGLYVAELSGDIAADWVGPVAEWLRECFAQRPTLGGQPAFVLNVAGPRESKSRGIGQKAGRFLTELFHLLKEGEPC